MQTENCNQDYMRKDNTMPVLSINTFNHINSHSYFKTNSFKCITVICKKIKCVYCFVDGMKRNF